VNRISQDKEYRYRTGKPATILTTNRKHHGRWTVISMTERGSLRVHDEFGISTSGSDDDLVEVTNWDCFHKGQIVEVRRGNGSWRLRRFHSISSCGRPMTINEIERCVTPNKWDECRAPCDWDVDTQKGPCKDEVGPYDHIREGDVVEVRLRVEKNWHLRRFSHVSSNGYPVTYANAEASTAEWDECRLVCRQEDAAWRTT
jgi:hypothetical protein